MGEGASEAVCRIGDGSPVLFGEGKLGLILGPCVLETREKTLRQAERLQRICSETGLPFVFKASYDKANRTSVRGERGLGIDEGLRVLLEVQQTLGLPVVSDVHSVEEAKRAAEVVDLVQIPAFLCRQTDLLVAAGSLGKPVMVKKGQFLAPEDMEFAVEKVRSSGAQQVMVCERGSCFGYRRLVNDFTALPILAASGCPVVFDATHSVQVMGGAGGASTGNRQYVTLLARAAVAAGVGGVFLECHEDPASSPSDGPNMLSLDEVPALLLDLKTLHECRLETR